VFLKLWLMGDGILEISNLEAYLRTLTKNRSLNVLRRMVLEGKVEKALAGHWTELQNDTEEEVLMKDIRNVLDKAVDLLPLQQKQVYKLCQQQGLKYEEAAERLQLSPLTVQTHMKRALKSVRAYVQSNTDIVIILIILKLL
jgi:RNA polymerase sigma factor (sigma-70 family)